MKIAITANGNTMNATISKVFARCNYFAIVDTETAAVEFIENQYKSKKEHAGEEVAEFLSQLGIKRIISCEFGSKAKSITDKNKIQLVVFANESSTIQQILDLIHSK